MAPSGTVIGSEFSAIPGPEGHPRDPAEMEIRFSEEDELAQSVAEMEVTVPEVLRVTEACQAFEHFAAALRPACHENFFYKSQQAESIGTFWSHSWHGNQWKKILTLMTFYNGTAAIALGFVAALVMMLFFSFDLLPGFYRGYYDIQWSTWCLLSALLVSSGTLLLWRPKNQVFLDRICINQANKNMKTEAILSLAGLLRKSDTMLILWDPSWTTRLWCLFELSAFLKSSTTRKQTLVVRPIFLGRISIAVFLTLTAFNFPLTIAPFDRAKMTSLLIPIGCGLLLGVSVGYWTVSTVRKYFRELEVMKQQLLDISFDLTRSTCCDLKHQGPAGEVLLCDRKVVKRCVNIWFGSQEAFENTVRSEVLEILSRDLSERVFTTPWVLGVTSPVVWSFMDFAASFAENFDVDLWWRSDSICFLLEGLSIWLLAIPSIKDVMIPLSRLMQSKPASSFAEVLKNAGVSFIVSIPIMILLLCYVWTRNPNPARRAVTFTGCTLVVSMCWSCVACALKARLRLSRC